MFWNGFTNIASAVHTHAAAMCVLTQREGIPPAPLQHLQPPLACQSADPSCNSDDRTRNPTAQQASCKRDNHASLRSASLLLPHESCGSLLRRRCRRAPTFPPLPLASARAAQTGHRVSASVRSGSWGTHGVVALARPSGQALGSSPAALPDPAPGPGALRHEAPVQNAQRE